MTADRPRTLAHEVTDAFRVVITSTLAMAAVLGVALTWFVTLGDPAIDRTTQIVSLSQDERALLLQEQSMLGAYVVTGDRTVVLLYPSVNAQLAKDAQALKVAALQQGSQRLVVRLDQAVTRWHANWAAKALDPATRRGMLSASGTLDPIALYTFVSSGKPSFFATQLAAHRLLASGLAGQTKIRHTVVGVVAGAAGLLVLIGAVTTAAALRRRRLLCERVVGPVEVLLDKVQAVGRGEFGPSPVVQAPLEIQALREGLADMSASLRMQQQVLATRADSAAASAHGLKLVIEFAREISDSLTLDHVLGAVTSAGRRLVESPRARVWLVDDDGRRLRLRHDSITGDVVVATTRQLGEGEVGRAAADSTLCYSAVPPGDGSPGAAKAPVVAVPLLKGTRLIGVLEIALQRATPRLDADTIAMLTVTAAHAATAIDAALLYALSESLSRSDPLTGLANRRQLDADLELELERAGRYHRPLTFIMIDIDHFKTVNDTFGHARGDEVLCEVATMLREHLRESDTAYRYGGEEFAVLARETDTAGGLTVAERVRHAIEQRYAAGSDTDVTVTISVGIASVPRDADAAPDLVAAADAALYEAKRDGRNRVKAEAPGVPEQRDASAVGVLG